MDDSACLCAIRRIGEKPAFLPNNKRANCILEIQMDEELELILE